MNFGYKVVIGYSSFVILIVSMVVFCFQQDFYLESENYYEKEVNYGTEQASLKSFHKLNSDLKIESNSTLDFFLPDSVSSDSLDVQVVLKRPNNALLDAELAFEKVAGKISIPYDGLVQGVYNLELSFNYKGENRLRKKGIYISPK